MLDKVWTRHAVATGPGGRALLYVDRHLVHEGSFHAFEMLRGAGRRVRRPDLTVAVADHYVPTAAGRERPPPRSRSAARSTSCPGTQESGGSRSSGRAIRARASST